MSIRLPLTCLLLTAVTCTLLGIAHAQPKLAIATVPACPPGYLLVEEEMWSQLMDEAGRHLDRARESFLHGHTRTTALELRKAAIMMRIDAAHGQDRVDLALIKSAHELEVMALQLHNPQNTDSIDDLDEVSSKALAALADHEHLKADLAWKHHHFHRAGRYLRSSADNLERATFRARVALSTSTTDVVRDARVLSGRLIEGTGYAIDEVGLGIDALGKQIKHFGHAVLQPAIERR
ncbi:MAG: putative periplasmic protein [Planctomycetaceae bacterium]|nr:putative periplasmic protein [Planctomycetaceae bacterium]